MGLRSFIISYLRATHTHPCLVPLKRPQVAKGAVLNQRCLSESVLRATSEVSENRVLPSLPAPNPWTIIT